MAPGSAPIGALAQFAVQELLGEGGYGRVYRAVETKFPRDVALKFLAPDLVGDRGARDDLLREARTVSKLNHENIAVIHNIIETDGDVFLVFEYCPGGTLRIRISGRQLPLSEIMKYSKEILSGLEFAHSHGIVHRDLKPQNILFSESGRLKIIDFGLARMGGARTLSAHGSAPGTPSYMSPEQTRGGGIGHHADIWAFGVMLYEFAAGRRPFQADSVDALIHQIRYDDPPKLSEIRPDLPADYEEVVLRCLAKDPAARFASAGEILEALQKIESKAEEPTRHKASESGQTLPEPSPPSPPRKPVPWLLVLAIALSVVLVAVDRAFPDAWQVVKRAIFGPVLPADRTVAVLPFVAVGGAADESSQDYFDGLREQFVALLSSAERYQSRSFQIVSTYEMRQRGVKTAEQARQRFKVTLVLLGKVLKSKDETRVFLELVDTTTMLIIATEVIPVRTDELVTLPGRLFDQALKLLALKIPQPSNVFVASAAPPASSADVSQMCLSARGILRRFEGPRGTTKAIELLEQALAKEPGYVMAKALLAEAYNQRFLDTRDKLWLAKADTLAREAVEKAPSLVDAQIALGNLHYRTGRYQDAARDYQQALKTDPRNEEALRRLGFAYMELRQWNEAEDAFKSAIQFRPGYVAAYVSFGVYYDRRNLNQQALEQFRYASRLADDPLSYSNLGGTLIKLGLTSEAEAALQKAIDLKPDGPLAANPYSNLGEIRYEQRRFPEAVELYRKAAALDERRPVHWGNLAKALIFVEGSKQEALDAYSKAEKLTLVNLEINPKNTAARASLAVYQVRLGKRNEGLRAIQAALREDPKSTEVLSKASLVYELGGQRQPALKYLSQAVSLGYPVKLISAEPVFDALRADPGFASISSSKPPGNRR